MMFPSLLVLATLSASLVTAQIPPVYAPPDGNYYIYNVQYKRVFDDVGFSTAHGNPIMGWTAVLPKEQLNQQWVVETVDYTEGSHKFTMRVLNTVQKRPDAGGYAANENGKIVHSYVGETWTLQPVSKSEDQFMIVNGPGTHAITLVNGRARNFPEAQLTAEVSNSSAVNQRWIFVPVDQMVDFVAENGSG